MIKQVTAIQKKKNKALAPRVLKVGGAILLLLCVVISLLSQRNTVRYTREIQELPKIHDYNEEIDAIKESKWKTITTQPGDSLAIIFKRVGLSQQTLLEILKNNPHAKLIANIKPQQKIQFLIHENNLKKLIIPINQTEFLLVSYENHHYHSQISTRKMTSHNQYVTATIRGSLFSSAKRAGVSYQLVQQMIEIFKWKIDFARDVRSGDQFTMVYKAFYIGDTLVNTGEIIAVSYNNHGKTFQAILHNRAHGRQDYFTPEGLSLRKAFSRYPLNFSHISSTFSLSRMHPILHYRRPHLGVDLAARIGTPVHATGDGRIVSIGRQNGYGNMIKIAHSTMYSSVYGHLLRFQKGLSRGTVISRGQVIGYVGQSGLATAPHCHYEFHVRQRPQNPTTVDLPHAAPVPANEMAAFKTQAGTLLASLRLYESAHLV